MSYPPDYGKVMQSVDIEKGLKELNPDIHFDLGGKFNAIHPYIADRQGVWYKGRHVCSMDRGPIPEYKIWMMSKCVVEVPWSEVDKEDVWIQYVLVNPAEPGYDDLCILASRNLTNDVAFDGKGRLMRLSCRAVRNIPSRVLRVGWRHTFYRMVAWGVPGITNETLSKKFNIDMSMVPFGSPEEIRRAVIEE